MKYFFTLPAFKYFEDHPRPPANIDSSDKVEVILDTAKKSALFSWKSANGKPCSFPVWIVEEYNSVLNQVLSHCGKAMESS